MNSDALELICQQLDMLNGAFIDATYGITEDDPDYEYVMSVLSHISAAVDDLTMMGYAL